MSLFESALVRRHNVGSNPIDAGMLAETLLFYNSVHIVLDGGLLYELILSIGANNLIELLEEKNLMASYSRTFTGVMKNTTNYVNTYSFAAVRMHAKANKKKILTTDEISESVERALGVSKESKKIAKKLIDKFSFRDIGFGNAKDRAEVVRSELIDDGQLASCVEAFMKSVVPRYVMPRSWEFRCIPQNDACEEFHILTDLKFDLINMEYYKSADSSQSPITPEWILSHILDAKVDVDLASRYMSEIITTPILSDIIRIRFDHMLLKRERSQRDISLFQETHLNDARAVREAINSGERGFSDFMVTLRKAPRFKQWLADRNPDSNLLQEYYKAALADSWINKLPVKGLRYIISSVSGLINTAGGLAVGAADAFLADRILKGWRPNQFIEGPLKKFVSYR